MTVSFADRVRETTTTAGTGTVTLAGIAPTDYQRFQDAFPAGATVYYAIINNALNEWEVGLGTFTAPVTLARTSVLTSSNSNSLVNFSAGPKDVWCDAPASLIATFGTVSTVSVVTANGVSASVANPTTSPALTFTLGAITPTSVNGNTITAGSTSGTNTGDQTLPVGANPTAKVGTAIVNGSAATFMRSDAAPPVDLTFTPTWTGLHTFNNGITIGGALTQSTGAVSMTPTGASSISVSGGTLNLDSSSTVQVGTANATGVTIGHQSATPSTITIAGKTAGFGQRGQIDGFQMSCTTATTTLTITAGECRDSTNVVSFASAITSKILGTTWAVGNAANGLDTGSPAASTWYYVFAIMKDSNGVGDILFSLSSTAPTMPSGYTFFRIIGAILSDGIPNITKFRQIGNFFKWLTITTETNWNSATVGTSVVTATLGTVPQAYRVQVVLNALYSNAGAHAGYIFDPDETGTTVTGLAPVRYNIGNLVAGFTGAIQITVFTNATGQISAVTDTAGSTVSVGVVGWFDPRGTNA